MQVARIENWSVCHLGDAYTPPECMLAILHGDVIGHPRLGDMKGVNTTKIVSVKGNVVTTRNTEYTLGKPSEEYVAWCKLVKCHVPTDECPIKI